MDATQESEHSERASQKRPASEDPDTASTVQTKKLKDHASNPASSTGKINSKVSESSKASPSAASSTKKGPILQFYSKSKDNADLGPDIPANWRKILSNFWKHEVRLL
mmetsp:Transcript_141803/g.200828  ORF Transcript_141803/g.200828 Transcript_141803/m.200828 type:complete len:108 (-) Transcript_141803:7-330(-)